MSTNVITGGGVVPPGGLGEGLNNLMPMMEGMMHSLLSKDLLYPAMKELADKVNDPLIYITWRSQFVCLLIR